MISSAIVRHIGLLPIVLAAALMTGSPLRAAAAEQPQALSSMALIEGVPYISWADATRLDYADKDTANPSMAASFGMLLNYWGEDLAILKESAFPDNWHVESLDAQDLTDLKRYIAQGIPVYVSPAITPTAHVPSPTYVMFLAFGPTRDEFLRSLGERPQFGSGVLGQMESFENIRIMQDLAIRATQNRNHVWESLLVSARVVIGYDDKRKVVILHDPSFGPAWEVSYGDFEAMWEITGRRMLVGHPRNHTETLARRPKSLPYPPRTPDQQAAQHLAFAEGLLSVGRASEAEQEVAKGLAVRGLSDSYRHLLTLEQAILFSLRGDLDRAEALARRAIDLLPEHHRPWQLLAALHGSRFGEGAWQKAAEAERKAEALCADREAQMRVAKALARDFFIFGCAGLLGPVD